MIGLSPLLDFYISALVAIDELYTVSMSIPSKLPKLPHILT